MSICSRIHLRFHNYVPMKKRTVLIASLVPLTMLLLGVVTLVSMNNGEPTNGGHTLSYWLETPLSHESRSALLAIGTNAIPHLLYWMTNRPPPWKPKLAQTLGPWIPASTISRLCEADQTRAMMGFMMLEPTPLPRFQSWSSSSRIRSAIVTPGPHSNASKPKFRSGHAPPTKTKHPIPLIKHPRWAIGPTRSSQTRPRSFTTEVRIVIPSVTQALQFSVPPRPRHPDRLRVSKRLRVTAKRHHVAFSRSNPHLRACRPV